MSSQAELSALYSTRSSRIPSVANNTNPTLAKAGPGTLKHINCVNAAATVRYIKFYDKVTAPTVGTDTPVLTVAVPATSAFRLTLAHQFAVGIGYGIVTGAADNDTTAPTAADILGLNVLFN